MISRLSSQRGNVARLRKRSCLILHVFEHAANGRFRGEDIAGRVDRDAFAHGALGRVGLVRRHEDRDLAVLQAAAANALEPARMPARLGLGVGGVDEVITADRQPANPSNGTVRFPTNVPASTMPCRVVEVAELPVRSAGNSSEDTTSNGS